MADLNDGRVDLHRSRGRFVAFSAIAATLLLVALGGRLFQLQVVNGDVYAGRAAADRTVEVPIPAPRGLIFDRDGRPIAVSVPSWTVKVRPADLPAADRSRVLSRVALLTGADRATLRARLDAFNGSPFDLVPIQRGVGREAALLIGEEAEDLPGVVISVEPIRQYLDETGKPGGPLLSHVVGYTGPIDREELDGPRGRRLPAATTSSERRASRPRSRTSLRGTYGAQLVERDASGRQLKVIETIREPIAGTNLMLTIDADVQRLATQGAHLGHGGRRREPGRDRGHEPADRRDPGDGLPAGVRQQQVRRRHQRR